MKNKDALQVAAFWVVWMLLAEVSFKIGGGFGLAVLALGTVIMVMFAYYQYRKELAYKREREKVKMLTDKINEICEREKRRLNSEGIKNHYYR